jgi:hypothetical protein
MHLWRLVLAVWLAPTLLLLPASLGASAVLGDRLGALPDDGAAPGDVEVILAQAALDHGMTIGLAVMAAVLLAWLWTVTWHAGVVRWQQWSASPRPRLTEVVGLGLVGFWPFARLALTSTVATALCWTAIWGPASVATDRATRAMADHRVAPIVVAAALLTLVATLLLWAVTHRAAWMLALPRHRSVVLIWLRALNDTLRRPLSSVGVVLVWTVPALGLGALSVLVGPAVPPLLASVLSQTTALLRAFCWVALFCSFATVTGLWPPDEDDASATPDHSSP